MEFYEMSRWSRRFDLVTNRIGVFNQVLGCRYDHSPTNPMRLVRSGRGYDVTFDGDVLTSFSLWDLAEIERSFAVVDQWSSCVWQLGRFGVLAV